MTFSPFVTNLKNQTSFKQRYPKPLKKPKLTYGDTVIFFSKESNFELIFYKLILKFLKKNLTFKKKLNKLYFKKSGWLPLRPNIPLTKKAKNSRMGKGKGGFIRWVIRCKIGNTLIETKNISSYRLKKLIFFLKKKTNFQLNFFKKKNKYLKVSSSSSLMWYL